MDAAPDDNTKDAPSGCAGCAERDRRIAELEARLADLNARLGRLETAARGAKRQAAPFSKGPPKADPKRPGRKPGDGYGTPHARRAVPPRVDEVLEAALPASCPYCGCGEVSEAGVVHQYQAEIPREVIHRQFNVHVGKCAGCRRRVQGRHPLQTSDAIGAAASQLGPDAQALAVQLNKDAGLSHGKVSRFFADAFGLDLSRAAACRVMLRAARRCEPAYAAIVGRVQASPSVVPDETGWRVGGELAWLHVAVGVDATAYLVHRRRGYEAAVELIGADYGGFLTRDGWAPYGRFDLATHQACLAHLLRRATELAEAAGGGDAARARFPLAVKAVLKAALAARDGRDAGELTAEQARAQAGLLSGRVAALLSGPPQADADHERFAAHLWEQQSALFTFLEFGEVDATNHRAEQAIRPAVVNRKVWGGNRTEAGAAAQSVLTSVLRTAAQRGLDSLGFISDTLKACFGRQPQIVPGAG
jgi:transposase